ncbi:MAG: restriction endonuclease subunit S [Chitinophagales bacterium]|nr:restriction endonuclease subunit S [Chitinophagales bacterium]
MESTISRNEIPYSLPENWTWYNWGDLICDYQQGIIRSNRELNNTGTRYLKMNNLDNKGGYSTNNIECTDITEAEFEKYKLNKNDFLINVRNSKELVGKTCVIGNEEDDLVFNHMLVRIKHHPEVSNIYINALLNTQVMRKFIDRCKKGTTTVIALYQQDLYKIPIPLPDTVTQNLIASFVESVSTKIEINNRINLLLEEMCKTIYNYWFVQFDFPDKNGKPYKSNGGAMEWNEELQKEIPKGWKVVKMAEWLLFNKSGDWGKEEKEGNFTKKVTCIRGADINGLNGLDDLNAPDRYILAKNEYKLLESHDIIIEISGGSPTQSTGRLAYITDATLNRFQNPLICSNFCKPVTLKNKKLLYNFVYYWNTLYENGVLFGYEGKTSGIKNLLLDSFVSSYNTLVPDDSIVNEFYNLMENVQNKKQKCLEENEKLDQLRTWLFPMLTSGRAAISN